MCVWTGPTGRYSENYIRTLRASVKRWSPPGTKFLVVPGRPGSGYWSKLNIFDSTFQGRGRILFLDLDTVIVGPLAPIAATPIPKGGIVMVPSISHNPLWRNSAVMLFEGGDEQLQPIHGRWHAEGCPVGFPRGDQEWIPHIIGLDKCAEFDRKYMVSYKVEAHTYLERPNDLSLVLFHGVPRPHEVTRPDWCMREWRE